MASKRLTDAYRLGNPEACILGHLLHARESQQAGAEPLLVLYHRLAAGIIALRIEWDQIDAVIADIGLSDRPDTPPMFAEIVDTLAREDGLALEALLDTLPGRRPGGDQAIAELWERVASVSARLRDAHRMSREEIPTHFWTALPPSIRRALALEGDEMDIALRRALQTLPKDEAESVLERLQHAGVLGGMTDDARDDLIAGFDKFLKGVVAVALGDDQYRDELERLLPELERSGWHIMVSVLQIWEGRRDEAGLCAGLDPASIRLVKRILALIQEAETGADTPVPAPIEATPEAREIPPEPLSPIGDARAFRPGDRLVDATGAETFNLEQRELLEDLPEPLRMAFALDADEFGDAMGRALATLPPDQAMGWMERMFQVGLVGTGDDITVEEALEHLDPFLFDIALVARGREALRPGLESHLLALEQIGMRISDAVFRIWAGERDLESLTAGLDPANTLVVRRILDHLGREIV